MYATVEKAEALDGGTYFTNTEILLSCNFAKKLGAEKCACTHFLALFFYIKLLSTIARHSSCMISRSTKGTFSPHIS